MATPNLSYQNFFTTTLSSSIVAGDTTIPLVSVPTPSEGYLVIEPDSSTNREIIYYTSVGGSFVTCPSAASGRGVGGTTAISHSSGATVQLNNNAEYWTNLQDGSALSGLHTWFNESFQDYVQSGGAVSSATGLIGSISAGVYYINGRRVTTNATSKTFTASKDVYVDVTAPSSLNNIATLSYVEVASGVTAGSALTSNSVRIAKVNTGASTIGTVSQGGVPNGVTDKLSNLVYPIHPVSRLIGHAIATANTTNTSTTTTVQIAGLSITCTVPAYQTVKVSVFIARLSNVTAANGAAVSLWDGAVETGTILFEQNFDPASATNAGVPVGFSYFLTNTTSSAVAKVFNAGLLAQTGGTATLLFKGESPIYGTISAELV